MVLFPWLFQYFKKFSFDLLVIHCTGGALMKSKYAPIAALCAIAFISGCASKPPAIDEPLPAVEVPSISDEELGTLEASVLAARKEAFELGAKDAFPEDYAAADARYLAGKEAMAGIREDDGKRAVAKEEYQAALPLFQDLADRAASAAAESGRANAGAARKRAVESGAEAVSADAFAAADTLKAEADAALAAGKAREAALLYRKAVFAYDAAEKRSRALSVKGIIDELDYGPMDAGNYALAGEKIEAMATLIASDQEAANDAASEALLRYNLVLKRGWELKAGSRKGIAEGYKRDAEAIKAQVAVKAEYATALAAWNHAQTAFASENFEGAAALFEEAEALFKTAYELAAQKRAAAELAIKAASESALRSEAYAREGDQILEGGEALQDDETDADDDGASGE